MKIIDSEHHKIIGSGRALIITQFEILLMIERIKHVKCNLLES